uniref:Biogenesis of lysosome-related organelles complex 1 subunit 1 n=1 Tax=Zea mays TaxID=4577 RepID=A0A804PWV3_MAIZE
MDGAKPVAAGKQDLEEALLRIVQQHHHQSLCQRQQTERAKKDALKSAVRVADLLVDTVDGGVRELFVNEKRIELEARALLGTIARYRRQTDEWLAATSEINSALKLINSFIPSRFISPVPNTVEFADWIGRTKQKKIRVTSKSETSRTG